MFIQGIRVIAIALKLKPTRYSSGRIFSLWAASTALRFMTASVSPLAAKRIPILLMNQHA
jgi:hypothetical protein